MIKPSRRSALKRCMIAAHRCQSDPDSTPGVAPTLTGSVQSGILYPVVVRFNTVNYAGVSTNNYALTEVEEA